MYIILYYIPLYALHYVYVSTCVCPCVCVNKFAIL